MLSLLNPSVILAILIALSVAFGWGHHKAYVEQQEQVARIAADLQSKADISKLQFDKEKEYAQKTISKLRADVNSGAVRLSIPVSSTCNTTTGVTETRAELDTTVSQDLITIADDGDKAIRDLNYCIDRYNEVKDAK